MNHGLMLPIVLPLVSGSILLVGHTWPVRVKQCLSLLGTWFLVPISVYLMAVASEGDLCVYRLGDWAAPFGIILLLDRLSALMLLVTAVLAGWAVTYAEHQSTHAPNAQALYQFQLLGINGAFLTGDLFNLFVFFEILLIASYALLIQGQTVQQVRSALHYVVVNLVGSALFLIAVSLLYGVTGTLNMADLSVQVAKLSSGDQAPLLRAAGLLLLIVFALKAAVVPLHFWLPAAYSSASGAVAALFSVMTKVGVYAIVRVFTLIFGSTAGSLAGLGQSWLWPLALLSLLVGALNALAARDLMRLVACLVVVSVGILMAGVALETPEGLVAALFYVVHSTWSIAGLFLLADLIVMQRGAAAGVLMAAPRMPQTAILGSLFFIAAVSVAGLPPFSGFLGKLLLLRASLEPRLSLWLAVIVSGFLVLIALSRAGSQVFWRVVVGPISFKTNALNNSVQIWSCIALLSSGLGLMLFAQPVLHYVQEAVAQLLDVSSYTRAVLGVQP